MDLIDGSGLWSSTDGVPVPPPPPGPVALIGTGRPYEARASRVPQTDPWADLVAWWQRLRRTPARITGGRVDRAWVSPEMLKRIEADDMDIVELTQLTRRRP